METATGMGQSPIQIIILYLVGTMRYSIHQINALLYLSLPLMYAIKYTITQAVWNLGSSMKISILLYPPTLAAFSSSMVQEVLYSYCIIVRYLSTGMKVMCQVSILITLRLRFSLIIAD